MTGNTVFETSFVENGITYKAEIQNVNRSGDDAITAVGMGGGYPPSYSIPVYNPDGNTEAIKTLFPNVGSVTYDIKFTAERNGTSYPVKIAVFDAQVTNHDFSGWEESLAFTTNGSDFTLLEEIGGNPNSNAITGISSQTITYLNTRPDDYTIPARNAIFTSRGTDLKITTEAKMIRQGGAFSSQSMAYAVVLNCDTDGDGTPDYLDLDSDNDGCPDALEGDATIKPANLKADGSINSPTNSQGIPTLVGSGQLAANSIKATKMGADTPLTDQTYQLGQTINFNVVDAYQQTTDVFNAGVPDYAGTIKQDVGLNYQWQVSTDNGTTFADITDETDSNLSLTGTADMDNNIYRLMANCDDRYCYQEVARSKLTLSNDTPVITTHNTTIKAGDSLDLLSLVDSITDTEDGTIAVNATNVTITNQGGFDPNTAGAYTITYSVTDSHGNISTEIATVTVDGAPTLITVNKEIVKGEAIDLMALATATDLEDDNTALTNNIIITNDGDFDNSIPGTYTITYQVTDSAGNTVTKTATVKVKYAHVFDPPSARKTVSGGETEMEWKMVWINDGNTMALNTQVLDNIPTGTTYKANSLTCDARGTSITNICTYDSSEKRIRWEGNIAPDMGGTNEDDSLNEVVITFKTTVPPEIQTVENQAQAYYDKDADGDFHNDKLAGLTAILTNNQANQNKATIWHRPKKQTETLLLPNTGYNHQSKFKYLTLLGLLPIIIIFKKK